MFPFFNKIRSKIVEPLESNITGSRKLSYWRNLEKTQYLSHEDLCDIQRARLTDLIQYVWEFNPFYRRRMDDLALVPEDIRSTEDLMKLPVLTKAEVRLNTDELLSRGFDKATLHSAKTGGSTGKSLDLYFTEECSELRNACARRHDCWTGWRPGEPIAACWGNPKYPKSLREKIRFSLVQPYIYLDTMHVDKVAVITFLEAWRKVKPTLLYGHAHSLYLLADSIKHYGLDVPGLVGILSTSMMLIPSERKIIEDVFGAKVTDRYGCEEVSLIASECEQHQGMHLNIEHLVVEFLREDGTAASSGESGSIVVTDLMNKAMPFIRYQVEDVGVLTDRICSCGRGLPLMEHVTGRVADFLVKPDGTRVAGISLIENTLTRFDGIVQMQIVQNDITHIDLNIVRGVDYLDTTTQQLKEYFEQVFSVCVECDFHFVEEISPESSGKFRFSICRVVD
jgi:phenylacetate-CoA ligase